MAIYRLIIDGSLWSTYETKEEAKKAYIKIRGYKFVKNVYIEEYELTKKWRIRK